MVDKLYNKIVSDDDLMAVGCYQSFIDSAGKSLPGGIYLGETAKAGFTRRQLKKN